MRWRGTLPGLHAYLDRLQHEAEAKSEGAGASAYPDDLDPEGDGRLIEEAEAEALLRDWLAANDLSDPSDY